MASLTAARAEVAWAEYHRERSFLGSLDTQCSGGSCGRIAEHRILPRSSLKGDDIRPSRITARTSGTLMF